MRVLREQGYTAEERSDRDEMLIFTRPDRSRVVPVDPEWQGIRADDPIFNCLRRDLDVSAGRLLLWLTTSEHQ